MARRPRRATTGPDHGVEVVALDYRECQKSGGGIHCSTAPLVRDRH
jgi:N-dimethylarginine dimethylaminohydrolase